MAAAIAASAVAANRPWLIYHPKEEEEDVDPNAPATVNFFIGSSDDRPVVHSVELPTSSSSSVIGSGHGWLILYDSTNCSLSLFNPFTKRHLLLPSLLTLSHLRRRHACSGPGFFVDKIDIDSYLTPHCPITANSKSLPYYLIFRPILIPNHNPNTNPNPRSDDSAGAGDDYDITVFLILASPLMDVAFAKPGDASWKKIDDAGWMDAICHEGRLMTVKTDGTVVGWDFDQFLASPTSAMPIIVERDERVSMELANKQPSAFLDREITFFLVLSPQGELWRVKKEWKQFRLSIKVHRVGNWLEEVRSLEHCAIFVGGNMAFYIISPAVRRNCVYFAEQCRCESRNPIAIGLYSLESQSMETILLTKAMKHHPQPAWFISPFWLKERKLILELQ